MMLAPSRQPAPEAANSMMSVCPNIKNSPRNSSTDHGYGVTMVSTFFAYRLKSVKPSTINLCKYCSIGSCCKSSDVS